MDDMNLNGICFHRTRLLRLAMDQASEDGGNTWSDLAQIMTGAKSSDFVSLRSMIGCYAVDFQLCRFCRNLF